MCFYTYGIVGWAVGCAVVRSGFEPRNCGVWEAAEKTVGQYAKWLNGIIVARYGGNDDGRTTESDGGKSKEGGVVHKCVFVLDGVRCTSHERPYYAGDDEYALKSDIADKASCFGNPGRP